MHEAMKPVPPVTHTSVVAGSSPDVPIRRSIYFQDLFDSLKIGSSCSTMLECQPICTRYTNASHHRLRKGIGPASLPMSSCRHKVHTLLNKICTNCTLENATAGGLTPVFIICTKQFVLIPCLNFLVDTSTAPSTK